LTVFSRAAYSHLNGSLRPKSGIPDSGNPYPVKRFRFRSQAVSTALSHFFAAIVYPEAENPSPGAGYISHE
jgi:hypothetical protein